MRDYSVPVLTGQQLLTHVTKAINSCVTLPQVHSAVNWGRSLVRMQKFSGEEETSVSYAIDFIANDKATTILEVIK